MKIFKRLKNLYKSVTMPTIMANGEQLVDKSYVEYQPENAAASAALSKIFFKWTPEALWISIGKKISECRISEIIV